MTVSEAYLDNWRTSRVAPEVLAAMEPFMGERYGVPSGLFRLSMEADQAVEQAQTTIASVFNGHPSGLVFTSGATEANNLAILGAVKANAKKGKHIISTKVEHPSVMNTLEALAKEGYEVDFLNVDHEGFIDLDQLKGLLREDTILISMLYVNHIVGTIQPLHEVRDILMAREKRPLLHVDGVGAFGLMPLDVEELGIDLLSISSHKIHGPKGVGALWVRKGVRLAPIMHGVTSMSNLRPGEENVPGIVGFAKAAELAYTNLDENLNKVRGLCSRFMEKVDKELPEAMINGPRCRRRNPYNINISFRSIEGEAVTLQLDAYGISVSTGSACASRKLKTSYVIAALGKPVEQAHGSIRFSLSRYTTEEEIDYAVDCLVKVFEGLRKISAYRPELEGREADHDHH